MSNRLLIFHLLHTTMKNVTLKELETARAVYIKLFKRIPYVEKL